MSFPVTLLNIPLETLKPPFVLPNSEWSNTFSNFFFLNFETGSHIVQVSFELYSPGSLEPLILLPHLPSSEIPGMYNHTLLDISNR